MSNIERIVVGAVIALGVIAGSLIGLLIALGRAEAQFDEDSEDLR